MGPGGVVESFDRRLKDKVDKVLRLAEAIAASEESESAAATTGMSTEDFKRRIENIKEKIEKSEADEQTKENVKKEIKAIEKTGIPKMAEYDRHKEILSGRNSYSKTDPDAIFMRMKEDYMGNGQLKPGYNVQIATENQFITNYGLYQTAGDSGTLPSFLDDFKSKYNKQSDEAVADSGHGSQQNYEYMLAEVIVPYVKYSYFHMDIRKRNKCESDIYRLSPPFYNKNGDFYVCPMGQRMEYRYTKKGKTDLGYVKKLMVYEAQDCSRCNMRATCCPKRKQGNRTIEVSRELEGYKAMMRELLTSEKGLWHRSRRPIEPEAVFGQIKYDCGSKRFTLKSLPKVSVEFGLVAMAHNLRKYIRLKALITDGNDKNHHPGSILSVNISLIWNTMEYQQTFPEIMVA